MVGPSSGSVTVLEDERPYLGVRVREHGESFGEGPLEVLEVAGESPAAGKLRAGDVLLDVENDPTRSARSTPGRRRGSSSTGTELG